jgi:serine/threonine-protein kinase
VLSQPKRLALLSYLSLSNSTRFRRRDTVLSLFWPELDTNHARASLRQSLTFLRRSLVEGVIVTRGEEEIGVDPSLLWCDAVAFDSACEEDPQEAIRLYHGPFLPGLFVDAAAPELDAWIEAERGKRERAAAAQARRAVEQTRLKGDLATALELARLAVSLSPREEASVARLIEVLDQTGDRAQALAEYEAFARRLREEFDAEPAPETKALIQAVRVRSATSADPAQSSSDLPSRRTATPESIAPPTRFIPAYRRWLQRAGGVLAAAVLSLVAIRFSGGGFLEPTTRYDANVVAVAPFDVFPLLCSMVPDRSAPFRSARYSPTGRGEQNARLRSSWAEAPAPVSWYMAGCSGLDRIRPGRWSPCSTSGRETQLTWR